MLKRSVVTTLAGVLVVSGVGWHQPAPTDGDEQRQRQCASDPGQDCAHPCSPILHHICVSMP